MIPLPELLKQLDGLYQTALNLTRKAEEHSDDLDRQITFEEARAAILEEASVFLKAMELLVAQTGITAAPAAEIQRLITLADQIRLLDRSRNVRFEEALAETTQMMCDLNRGRHGVTQYQRTAGVDN